MDLRTGETFETREQAEAAGVPSSDIAEITRCDSSVPEVRFASGPFKDRVYKRMSNGQLVRCDARRGYVSKTDGAGNLIHVKA